MSSGHRISAADGSNAVNNAKEALSLMREALRLLDLHDGPHDVRAHIDLAINRLQASIDGSEDEAG